MIEAIENGGTPMGTTCAVYYQLLSSWEGGYVILRHASNILWIGNKDVNESCDVTAPFIDSNRPLRRLGGAEMEGKHI